MDVVAEAGTVDKTVQKTEKHLSDVVVMDLGMPGGSRLDAIRQILQNQAHWAVFSTHTLRNFPLFGSRMGGSSAWRMVTLPKPCWVR